MFDVCPNVVVFPISCNHATYQYNEDQFSHHTKTRLISISPRIAFLKKKLVCLHLQPLFSDSIILGIP